MKENVADVYNTSKLAFHEDKIKALASGKVEAPIYVRVKPTNKCDHTCSYCSYTPGSGCPVSETINRKDEIPKEKILEILSDFRDMGVKALTYSGGGEPLVYPHISEIMGKTLEYAIELSIITNGQKLRGERSEILAQAEWVRVSASESDAKTFAKTRKVPERWFYELSENIKNFAKIKKPNCELGINFVVHKGNAYQVYKSVGYFMSLGVNHIKITPVYRPDFEKYHTPFKDEVEEQIIRARQDFKRDEFTIYDTYENDFSLTGLSERKYPKCYFMQIVPVIGADSVVYFCHDKTYSKNGAFGNIKDRSFKDLWFSEQTTEIFKNFNPREECRHHCTYDTRNMLVPELMRELKELGNLERYQPKSNRHKNFV